MDKKDFLINEEYHSSDSSTDLELIVERNTKKTIGTENSLFDFDVSGLTDKPWNKPGEDITDYFNYGFDESTWKEYCNMQKNRFYKKNK